MITRVQLSILYLVGWPILLGMGAAILGYRLWCWWADKRERAFYQGLKQSLFNHLEGNNVSIR